MLHTKPRSSKFSYVVFVVLISILLSFTTPGVGVASALGVGTCGKVYGSNSAGGLAVRSSPGLNAPLIKRIADGTIVKITGGPVSKDGHTWWQHDKGGWSSAKYLSDTSCPSTTKVIGIEAGHSSTDPGAYSCDRKYKEADITNNISNLVAGKLRAAGYTVNVYRDNKYALDDKKFDAFVALHVDWCPNGYVSGYKVSRYGGDKGKGLNGSGDASDRLATAVWASYGPATGIPKDTSSGHFTDKFRNYWALRPQSSSYWSVATGTPGIIIEMGWMRDPNLSVLRKSPDSVATGIANGVINFLNGK